MERKPGQLDQFASVVESWLFAMRSDRTRSAYRSDLTQFAAWMSSETGGHSPLRAEAEHVRRYRAACADAGASESTVARRISAMRSFFEHAVATGAVRESPVGPWTRTRSRESSPTPDLEPRDVIALAEASRRLGDRTAVLVGLMLFDGLRLGDVLAADANDVSFGGRQAELSVARRDGRDALRLDARTTSALQRYLGGRRSGPLLMGESPTRVPSRLSRFGADYLIKQAGTNAGLGRTMSANVLRRGYVAGAHAAGTPIDEIRGRLGHTDVRTTRRHLTAPPEGRSEGLT